MAEEAVEETGKGSKKGLIMMIVAVLVAIGASIGGTLYFVGQGKGSPEDLAAADAQSEAARTAIYHQMRPSFIVNYVTDTKPRYLQAELAVMARDPELIEALVDHTPLVRARILKVLSNARFEDIRTDAGKEQLRETLLASLDEVIAAETQLQGLESILFTNFVLQ